MILHFLLKWTYKLLNHKFIVVKLLSKWLPRIPMHGLPLFDTK